jgi:hypothetical protein
MSQYICINCHKMYKREISYNKHIEKCIKVKKDEVKKEKKEEVKKEEKVYSKEELKKDIRDIMRIHNKEEWYLKMLNIVQDLSMEHIVNKLHNEEFISCLLREGECEEKESIRIEGYITYKLDEITKMIGEEFEIAKEEMNMPPK